MPIGRPLAFTPRKRFVGIDPGKTGCVCVIDGPRIQFYDTPVAQTGKKATYLVGEMADVVREATAMSESLVVLEQAGAMPGQGVSSTLSTGIGFGLWWGILATLGIPHQMVQPAAWHRVLMSGMPKTESKTQRKEQVAVVAARLYPQIAKLLRGPRGGLIDGRSDALMLAHYGKTHLR